MQHLFLWRLIICEGLMIILHFNQDNGSIIHAYDVGIAEPPLPNIVVSDSLWKRVSNMEVKVDLTTRKLVYTPKKLTKEEVNELRKKAYTDEADPLFFQYQRGEATKEEWLNKVAEIRARYPFQ